MHSNMPDMFQQQIATLLQTKDDAITGGLLKLACQRIVVTVECMRFLTPQLFA